MEPKNTSPHRRYNPLTDQWLLLSPQRTQRPWQGKTEESFAESGPSYDPKCFLCPGNTRMGGDKNDDYQHTFVFDNDFKALTIEGDTFRENEDDLFRAESVHGTCRVICFSRSHNLTLAEMELEGLGKVVELWKSQSAELHQNYTWVQIFENKGEIMGCSNPHPHGQIWASDFIPEEPAKEDRAQRTYKEKHGENLLLHYIEKEMEKRERIVAQNKSWLCVVPYWATWPFETLLLPKQPIQRLEDLKTAESHDLADIMQQLLVRYDNLFMTSFPYSMGWHGAPGGREKIDNSHWHLHAHYYPPLLRSADIKKFMVGFEMLGCAQRDILPEQAAEMLRSQSATHYKKSNR